MSTVTNQLTSFSEKLHQRLEIVAGSQLDSADKSLVIDALVMRTALLYDLATDPIQADKAATAWKRTLLGLNVLDVRLYAEDWKTCREILTSFGFRSVYKLGEPGAYQQHFKRAARGRIHYRWILNAVLALLEEGDPDCYFRANQFVVFDGKLNLRSLDLTDEMCREYLDFEGSFSQRCDWYRVLHGVPIKGSDVLDEGYSYAHRIVVTAKRAAKDLFGDFDIKSYPFRPRHGNGATLEVQRSMADAWHKNRSFRVDSEIIQYLKYRVPETEWRDWFYVPYKGLNRTSKLVCVPKTMVKNRTISKEPTTLQYLQQDLFQAFDDYFSSRLEGRVNLHDQTRSRLLAQTGSSDGSYATIDLSSASDSVSVDLIDYLFGDLPIGYALFATRSTHVDVEFANGTSKVIQTTKFAPMGSATCFPVESAVFAIICESAVRVQLGRRSRPSDYVVYGDDILIRDDCYFTCRRALELFGFSVNVDKSFGGEMRIARECDASAPALFREACGVECLDGVDITPLRLSRRLVSVTRNDADHQAGQGVGMIDLVNRAYLYGYRELRSWLNSVLNAHWWYRTCLYISKTDYDEFVDAVSRNEVSWVRLAMPFIITDDACDTNWRAWCARAGQYSPYQEYEARVTVVKSRKGKIPCVASGPKRPRYGEAVHDENDYFSWCLARVTRANDDDELYVDATGLVTLRSRDLYWSKQWVVLVRAAHPTSH